MHILNKDTFEQRRTGEHSGVTSLDRDLGDRRLLPDAADYSRFFATRVGKAETNSLASPKYPVNYSNY